MEKLFSVREVATAIGSTPSQIRTWITAGHLKAVRNGHGYCTTEAWLTECMAALARVQTAPKEPETQPETPKAPKAPSGKKPRAQKPPPAVPARPMNAEELHRWMLERRKARREAEKAPHLKVVK